MARKNGGARANSKQIRTDVDCRAARPKFDNGAWSPAKISDVTGGGLYLFVTPDESRPGNAASKHCGGHAPGEKKMILAAGQADADVAESIDDALVKEDVVRVDEVCDQGAFGHCTIR